LRNISISDAQADNCKGVVSLPGTYSNKWSNFQLNGNNDAYLDPGESFSYSCDKPQTNSSYTNKASVTAKGKNSGTDVNADDTSKVIVDTDTDSDVCPYTPSGNQILINFSDFTL
jgi:hypothetical protein